MTDATINPQERAHAEAMIQARDKACFAVCHLDGTDPIQVLISAAAKMLCERIPQGGRGKAIEIAQQQIERNVRQMLRRR